MSAVEESVQGGILGRRRESRRSSARPRRENAGCGEDVEVVGLCIGVGAPGRRSIVRVMPVSTVAPKNDVSCA
jgi:hypothetical protein